MKTKRKKVAVDKALCPRCGKPTDLPGFICRGCSDQIVQAKPLMAPAPEPSPRLVISFVGGMVKEERQRWNGIRWVTAASDTWVYRLPKWRNGNGNS